MNTRFLAALLCIAYLSPVAAEIIPGYYSAPGLDPNRNYLNQNFSEYIDPFTGKLQLHYVDLVLPGNGGLDLEVHRSYTNIEYTQREVGDATLLGARTPWGMGWTMHFGRVMRSSSSACARGSMTATTDNPILELPDGRHELLFDAWTLNSSGPQYLTASRWKADCATDGSLGLVVTSPEGVRYDMTVRELRPMGTYTEYSWYVSKITDRNGNTISFTYTTNPVNYLLLKSISTSDGRSLTFTYTDESNELARLTSISTPGRTWTYSYTAVTGLPYRYFLTQVTRPAGGSWKYAYNGDLGTTVAGSFSMNKMTYPTGGVFNYTYKFTKFDLADTTKDTVTIAKKTGDAGTWTFTYTPGTSYDVTTITNPGDTITYRHFGYSAAANGTVWQIGLLLKKTTGSLQTEDYTWGAQVISNENYGGAGSFPLKLDTGSRAPVLTKKVVTRDGTAYSSTYSLFDAYGNPGRLVESGNASRTTDFTYYIDTSKWIVKQLKNASISGAGTISRTYNSSGNLTNETRYGVSTGYSYFSTGDLSTVTDARSYVTTYSSYYRGVPRSIQQPEGVLVSRSVDNTGNITAETNGEGNTTTYSYDGIDRLTGIGFPIGSPVSITWGTTSRSVARGAYTESMTFDGLARPVSITRAGITTTATYDSLGRKTFESYPGLTSGTTFAWDGLGRLTKATHPDAKFRSYAYASSNKVTVTNERNYATIYTYRSFGDPDRRTLLNVTAPVTAANVAITRNLLDQPTAVTQNSKTRTYGYDSHFFLTTISNPETGTTTLGRDAVGNLASRAVGSSATVTYGYDGLNRLISITYPAGTPSVTQTWTNTGKLSTVASSVASRAYSYDPNDNLIGEYLTVDGLTFSVAYGIDSLDHVDTITYPSNRMVTYSPDALGRPVSAAPYVTTVSYDPSGQVSGLGYANGATTSVTFNSRQWPATYTVTKSATLLNRSYVYDAVGNPTSITDTADTTANRTLGYDAIDRVTAVAGPWGTGTIAYDGDGDLTSQVLGSFSLSYGYDTSNRLSGVSGSKAYTFAYDAYGDVTSNGVATFTYDDAPVLRCANCATSPIQYSYDGRNTQVKTVKGSLTNYSLYAANGDLLGIYDTAGAPIKEYAYLSGKLVGMYTANGNYQTSFHVDPAGSPVAATNEFGNLLWRENYRPYGDRLVVQDGGTNSLWFAGKVQDVTTGLSYFGARFYDPSIGRFMAVDPAEFSGDNLHSFNRYAYANNNPYKFVDPDGRNGVAAVGGVIVETLNAIKGHGFDGDRVLGALRDGYDGEGNGVLSAAIEDASAVATLAGGIGALRVVAGEAAATATATKGAHTVYEGIDKAGVVRYVGRTARDVLTRGAEHVAAGGGKEALVYRAVRGGTNLELPAARTMEQQLINQYGLWKNGGQLLNQINSISPMNWAKYGIAP
ncbi:MAG TPA: RHS repeat-associated core domain-containing protein [Burkholderiaceae bacterium]|nr:RHS repeat-associated core domain-containing protein [Burkholderiaceae bacterium]